MALLSHYGAAMAKTSSGDLGGFDPIFKYLNLFVQALITHRHKDKKRLATDLLTPVLLELADLGVQAVGFEIKFL